MKQTWLRRYIWLLLLFMSFTCCVASPVHDDWQSLYYRDHPFVGKVFSVKDKTWISVQQLDKNIQHEQIILLGETHTNPDHHIAQAKTIEKWLSIDKPSALVFEMLAYDDWAELQTEYSFKQPLESLHEKLEEISAQWDWEIYKPILEVQIKHQMPMIGANLTREQIKKYSASEQCRVSRFGVSLEFCDSITGDMKDAIKQLIFDAHCGYLPIAHTEPLLRAQLAKDASFALSLARMADTHNVALIAGAVHVRKDIGVPVHLQRLGKQSVSIAFVNVDPDKMHIEEYIDHTDLPQQFDYIYFTPSERNQDPCIEFAEQLKKMKKLTK
ncbi:MAG: ChaN family lipoprotein [Gammaproteobacteria bacterium]